jgi:murein DD-endopeptidase MepM/ murein hydrolase activator NlpD
MIRKFETFLVAACIFFVAVGGPTFAQDRTCGTVADHYLRAKALELAEDARNIRINGRDRDWQSIPAFHDRLVHDCNDRSRDLVSTSLAPLSDRILIMLETRGKPAKEDKSFWMVVDLMGARSMDFEIGFSSTNQTTFWIYQDGKAAKQTTIEGVKHKIGSHVTAEIPIAEIRKAYASVGVEFPADPLARGWVRVIPFTYKQKRKMDLGPSAASPVLDRPEFFENPVSAVKDKTQWGRSIPMPLPTRKWYVGQGAFGLWTHQSVHAYDLYIVDSSMEPASQIKSKTNHNYYCWEEDIVAPIQARVIRAQDGTVDNDPFDDTRQGEANHICLDIGGNAGLKMLHFRQNTVTVEPGELLDAGTVIGKVGNSASYACPHFHFDLWKLPNGKESMPAALENVHVSLNNADDCPWTREFSTWVIEEGLFVQHARKQHARKPDVPSKQSVTISED